MNNFLKIGVVGAGGFATFASKAFLKIDGVNISGVTDVNSSAAEKFAKELNTISYKSMIGLLKDDNINLVYIATPPFLHYEQSKAALLAGKHVICEKPAALKTREAEELASLAKEKNLLYVVNLMQRYNPVYIITDQIIKENIFGDFLHGYFENYASDEALTENHWFWDATKSGGIFIEHGVHFFDMFSGWFGEGILLNAIQQQKTGKDFGVTDRVHATVKYGDGIVNFYHGFNQPKILDRQELRLQFERGDIILYEWVPVKMKIHGIVTEEQILQLKKILALFSSLNISETEPESKKVRGNFKELYFDKTITIKCGDVSDKMQRYEEIIIAMLTDQWAWIKDKKHKRLIADVNAVQSLKIAEEAALKK